MFKGKLEFKLGPGRIFGLDTSHKTVAVTVIHPNQDVEQYEFSLDESLAAFLKQLRPEDRVGLEVTGNSWYLYEKIKPLVLEVVVADPKKIQLIARSQAKTDRNDSYIIALMMAVGCLPTVWMPDPQTQGDRELLRARQALLGKQTRVKNQTRALLANHGVKVATTDLNAKDAQLFLTQVQVSLTEPAQQALASHLRELEFYAEEVRRLDAQVTVRSQRRKSEVDLLKTCPGIGLFVAFTLLAVVGTVSRFAEAKSLGNYTGDVPAVRTSAGKSWSGGITRSGPKLLRWALTEAVESLIRSDGYFRNMYQRIKKGQKKRHNLAVTACARELAEVVWKMLTTGRPFQECVPQLHTPSNTLAERRAKQQQRKDRRERQRVATATDVANQQPPPIDLFRSNIDQLTSLVRVSNDRAKVA